MKHRLAFTGLALVTLFLALVPTALASTTWYVDGVNGNDSNNCLSPSTACKTIGHAISLASSGDTIMVAAATYRENLTIGLNLKIVGARASTTIIDGGHISTVVTISNASARVTLSKLTIQNGFVTGLIARGGGINNVGTLTISNSTLTANSATGARFGAQGGGIYNSGTLTIDTSTVRANTVSSTTGSPVYGGGIYTIGTLTINKSTLSGNSGSRSVTTGGGIYTTGGRLTINNSTVNANSASFGGGIANGAGLVTINNSTLSGNTATASGGGIYGNATVQNIIVANSPFGGNCSGTITSNGYNLSGDNSCSFDGPGDLNNTDPKLGPLQNNGGPTQTMALLSGSPAIDAGNPSGCTDGQGHLLKTDQRGQPRPDREDSGGCDMGAFERQTD